MGIGCGCGGKDRCADLIEILILIDGKGREGFWEGGSTYFVREF